MLKVLCFCIALSLHTLQVKSLGDFPKSTPKEPSDPKIPAALKPGQPTVDAKVDVNVKAAADAQNGCKTPAAPKKPSYDVKVAADVQAPVAPKVPSSTPKAPSAPKTPSAPEEPAAPKAPSAPEEPAAPKTPSAPEEPAAPKNPSAPKSENTSCFKPGLDYCWADYDGTVPPDALPASDDPEKKAYVGMARPPYAFAINCTGTLIEKRVEMVSECYGKPKITKNLKILTVKDKAKFQWVKTSKETFWKDIKDKGEPFTSGKNKNKNADWFVGRVTTEDGTTEIGHIASGVLYFIHNNNQKKQNRDYDVLIRLNEKEPEPA